MDCNHARLLLLFSRTKADLDPAEMNGLRGHLDQCADCDALALSEQQLDEVVGRAMCAVPVPQGARERLLLRLQRERRVQLWRRGLALAATLLLGVGLAGYFFWSGRTEVDLEVVLNDFSDKVGASPQKIEQWFQKQGLPMEAPPQFNYAWLYDYDTAHFMNRRVPRLRFVSQDRDGVADVYVLSDRQFNLDNELANQRLANSSFTIEVLKAEGFLYVVVYKAASLAAFVKQPGA